MRVLITGGAGFIGSHLSERLLARGDSVIVLDNFHTGQRENLRHLIGNDDLEIFRQDVTDPFKFEVDMIYNLACPASPIHYQRSPVKTVVTSVQGAINCLNLAHEIKARVLQASTSEVYGDPVMHPQMEHYWGNVNTIGPRSCYDEGKRVAETLMFDYYREYGVDIRVARIFNTYGPRMSCNDGRVISNFILQALRGEDITLFGDGSQTRSFCFVDDLVDGLIRLMDNTEMVGPVNLGNPVERTIREVAEMIVQMTGSRSEIIYKTLPQDDPTRRCPDITMAQNQLGWCPTVGFEEGISKTIEYFWPYAYKNSAPLAMPR